MGLLTPILPTLGDPNATEDADIVSALTALYGLVNGNLDGANISGLDGAKITDGTIAAAELASALAAQLGITAGGTNRRGYSEVLTSQTRAAGAIGDLATVGPSVDVTVPANGLVAVQAQVDLFVTTSGNAVVYLVEDGVSIGQILATAVTAFETRYSAPSDSDGGTLKGQAGLIVFPASAGAHTYKLQYQGFTNTGNFRNRKLWVSTFGP